MRNLLTRTLLTMVSADERSFRLARRTRTRLATFDKAHPRCTPFSARLA
jgi:hypothetical protein